MRVHPALMHAKLLLGSMNVGLMQIAEILCRHDKNQIHVHNHARVHTVSYVSVIIEPFCVINILKRLFFNHWIRA